MIDPNMTMTPMELPPIKPYLYGPPVHMQPQPAVMTPKGNMSGKPSPEGGAILMNQIAREGGI